MKTLNTYIEERLVLNKTRKYDVYIEILPIFESSPKKELICGNIVLNDDVAALFYFFNHKQSAELSSFYIYTNELIYDELFDQQYTDSMHIKGQQGAYPNKEFINKLNDAIVDEGFKKVQNNLIFLRTYDEIEADWGNAAPDCKTIVEKQKWVDWIKYFNEISGETLSTKIVDWAYSEL